MASSSSNPGGSKGGNSSLWHSGASSGGSSGGGMERGHHSPRGGSGNPPAIPPHAHSRQHREQVESRHNRERERGDRGDRETKNRETVFNLLSMLTLEEPNQPQSYEQSTKSQHHNAPSQSQSTPSAIDNKRMLLINMSNSPESCLALRRAGCIPLLIELLHPLQRNSDVLQPSDVIRARATKALKNIVQFNPDEKTKKTEVRVLKFLEGIRGFSDAVKVQLKAQLQAQKDGPQQTGKCQNAQTGNLEHPTLSITSLMKLSFDEEHRNTMCLLGAIHALADLVVSDHLIHTNIQQECILLRRYSVMTLTNLTFNDGTNKALLCGMRDFLSCLVAQLDCENEDICQVTASVLRNLSWKADSASRIALHDSNVVSKLTLVAIKTTKESTLKATLCALWNLSAHSAGNKTAICMASPNSLAFLTSLMRPNNPFMKQMKTPMTIIENAGGILRNISTQIARSPELRKILRDNQFYEVILEHLKSSSLNVVSNACGILSHLSDGAECEDDQRKLLDLNAIPMLKSLVYSKHSKISDGASSALRNLLASRFAKDHTLHLDSRLTAQIYSPGASDSRNNYGLPTKKSPNSDTELEMEMNPTHHYQPPPQLVQQEPPAAHQQSSSSLFQRTPQFFNTHKPLPIHFHNHPPYPHSAAFRHRPSTINYAPDNEPLDLTMTSAKSSPIHVISAAEFGIENHSHSMQHHHQRFNGGPAGMESGFYRPQSQNQNPYNFFNAPNLIHHTESVSPSSGSMRKYSFPRAKFNQSCPEILSRFQQQNLIPASSNEQECKPLDYSGSTSSSTRGGGEGVVINSDSNEGDTTFNYSLRFTEVESLEDPNNSHNNAGTNTKSDDTVKTYCCEGTPHNFSISNSCQDLTQECEYEKESPADFEDGNNGNGGGGNGSKPNKLQPIDEVPRAYYVENTPAVFSRTSSLSSINSSDGINAGENQAEYRGETCSLPGNSPRSDSAPINKSSVTTETCSSQMQMPPQPLPRKRNVPNTVPSSSRVTFSAEETPLMFSRCSSVASLDSDSLDVGGCGAGAAMKNDDDLSDYSRRASEVVSPSDLPDSPRALAPPVRFFEQTKPIIQQPVKREQKKQEDEIKVFTMEEKSGLNSCRSLSPLTVDGEELPIIGKGKIQSSESTAIINKKSSSSCRSLSPLTVDGEELPMISSKVKFAPLADKTSTDTIEKRDASNKVDGQLPSSGSLSNASVIQNDQSESQSQTSKPPRFPNDEIKLFATEGTPFYGVSNATSLSDLMIDIEETGTEQQINTNVNATTVITTTTNSSNVSQPNTINQTKNITTPTPQSHSVEKISEEKSNVEDEPIYSDAQLLEKCIKVGKALGIPKSHSEFRIGGVGTKMPLKSENSTSDNNKKLEKKESKSQDFEFDDPDLAALIMIGRNRSKDNKDKTSGKGKLSKKNEKDSSKSSKVASQINKPNEINIPQQTEEKEMSMPDLSCKSNSEDSTLVSINENDTKQGTEMNSMTESDLQSPTSINNPTQPSQNLLIKTGSLDSNQVSTMSIGSEWNDETETFSSIPSMSISTALRLAGSVCGDSSMSKPPLPVKTEKEKSQKQKANNNHMNVSAISLSLQNELLENIDPPSTLSNVVSSSDCVLLQQSPQLLPRSQNSTLSDKMNKKWKALNEGANVSSTHSNLSAQKPPIDFDLENSMISVASIRSEIYELSSSSMNNDIFESAVEDFGESGTAKPSGDTSLGGNTYTIFPPENANRLTGAKSTDLSDGGNTVVSEDFTDAEDIEDFETAPVDDQIEDLNGKPEKSDREKETELATANSAIGRETKQNLGTIINNGNNEIVRNASVVLPISTQSSKPLMEVHPLETTNKYNTFVVKKSPMSPRSSPRQKRREDPDRYRTRTINPVSTGKPFMSDANGNPDLKFATFRVGGPKIIKPATHVSNLNTLESDTSSISPESTPGHSPKGIRGRRKPLYSSLPPSAIIRKSKTAPPPIPPKPTRAASPARSTTSSTNGGVYVRPTRTTELRIAANNSREISPRRGGGDGNSSKNSSNSSLNLIHQSSRYSDTGIPIASPRPKVAPKPPVRTTPAIATVAPANSSSVPRGFVGSTSSVKIKTSNSSFGFGQQVKTGESVTGANLKGYSTLPKSSKLGTELPFSVERCSGESRESISGSEKSSRSGIGKITNLWRKMDFRNHHSNKDSSFLHPAPHLSSDSSKASSESKSQIPEKKSTGSKFSNIFGRNKNKEKSNPKPFRESLPIPKSSASPNFASDSTFATAGGVWVKRDGDNKVLVQPFNYTPPIQNPTSVVKGPSIINTTIATEEINSVNGAEISSVSSNQNQSAGAAGSAKITTV